LALAFAPLRAEAENEAAKAAARAKVQEGVARYTRGELQGALDLFDEAFALFPTPVIQFNRAQALRGLHREAEAAHALEEFLREASTASPERRKEAEQDLRETKRVLGRLKVACDVDGAEVLVDGRLVGKTPLAAPVWVKAGTRQVKVQKAGLPTFARSLEVVAAEEQALAATLRPTTAAGALGGAGATEPHAPGATSAGVVSAPGGEAAAKTAGGPGGPRAREGAVAESAPAPPGMSHAGQIGVFLRADVSLIGASGLVLVPGATYGVGRRLEIGAGALIGHYKGGIAEARLFLLDGRLKPLVSAALPVFVVDGVEVGVQLGAGLLVELGARAAVVAAATAVYFPGAPAGMDKAWFIPSLGTQLRL
jgi:hypothetical protein